MKRRLFIVLAAMLFLTVALQPMAQAVVYNLVDGNSSVIVDSAYPGAYNWYVGPKHQMWQQTWFYGDALGQYAIASPGLNLVSSSNPAANAAVFNFADPAGAFNITLSYNLLGGVVGFPMQADLAEQIRINNTSGSTLNFRLFLYTDLDLNGTPGGDTVQTFTSPLFGSSAYQSEGFAYSLTIIGQPATSTEVALFPNTLNNLLSGFYNLNGNSGPVGPGDVTWAFQWDLLIPAGGSVVFSLDKNVVAPIPGSLVLLGSGVLGLLGIGIRRKSL